MPFPIPLVFFTAVAAYFDLRFSRIPNWLTLSGCVVGLALNTNREGLTGLRHAVLGLLTGFALYLPLWLLHARGAGDVKLLAAVGAFLGPQNTLVLAIVAALVGGVLALALVVAKGATRQTAVNIGAILTSLVRFRRPAHTLASPRALRLPHAAVIFGSVVIMGSVWNG